MACTLSMLPCNSASYLRLPFVTLVLHRDDLDDACNLRGIQLLPAHVLGFANGRNREVATPSFLLENDALCGENTGQVAASRSE
jgi:hypothetical protein